MDLTLKLLYCNVILIGIVFYLENIAFVKLHMNSSMSLRHTTSKYMYCVKLPIFTAIIFYFISEIVHLARSNSIKTDCD